MEAAAAWIAPIATTIAALVTAANLGARVTGWGFAIFLVGALAWMTVGITTGQSGLLWSNAFLAVIDLVGIWRWLGRRASLDDGAKRAAVASARTGVPTLVPVDTFATAKLEDRDGEPLGQAVGAMMEITSGQVSYVVVRETRDGRSDLRHVAVPWAWIEVRNGDVGLQSGRRLDDLPEIDVKAWPAQAPDDRG